MTITIESAAIRLTDTILGYNEQDLEETLKAIAADIGVAHIAYMRFAPDKSSDASLLERALYLFRFSGRRVTSSSNMSDRSPSLPMEAKRFFLSTGRRCRAKIPPFRRFSPMR